MAKQVRVFVRLKQGVLDVQGKAVEHGLANIGIENVGDVRIGKLVELEVDCDDWGSAEARAEELCQKLLANPIIEDYEIQEIV